MTPIAYTSPNILASTTTWAQLKAGGASAALELCITKQIATVAPTVAATAAATGGGASGGALAAGTYYIVITETNGKGETTAGPESSQLTVSATNIPRITFQTLKTGNTARNVYVGAKDGDTGGPYTLYARGITASTYDMAVDLPTNSSAVAPPTTNTTALSTKQLEMLRACKSGHLQAVYKHLHSTLDTFSRGDPVPLPSALKHLREAHTTFAMLAAVCAEAGTLIDANAGTIAPVATGIGGSELKRTWS